MDTQHPSEDRLTTVAREYCDYIESLDIQEYPLEFTPILTKLSQLLPRLHASIAILADNGGSEDFASNIDLERRFKLYSRLRNLLGEMDAYWMEFDVARDGQEMSGSLADDLTDIYWELKLGLQGLDKSANLAPTLKSWGVGYRLHWGQHLIDAERHLYALQVRRS